MKDLRELKQDFGYAQMALNRKIGERDSVKARKLELEAEIAELGALTTVLDQVTILLNTIGEDKQKQAQEQIEGIVTRGLHAIFGETYSFHIEQAMKGKNASVEFTIRSRMGDATIETPVLEAHGGGLSSLVGLLLRVTVLLLSKSQNVSKVIVLDETFGMLSEEYLDATAEFIRELVDRAGLQVILITHQKEWQDYADITYKFGIRNGETYAKVEE